MHYMHRAMETDSWTQYHEDVAGYPSLSLHCLDVGSVGLYSAFTTHVFEPCIGADVETLPEFIPPNVDSAFLFGGIVCGTSMHGDAVLNAHDIIVILYYALSLKMYVHIPDAPQLIDTVLRSPLFSPPGAAPTEADGGRLQHYARINEDGVCNLTDTPLSIYRYDDLSARVARWAWTPQGQWFRICLPYMWITLDAKMIGFDGNAAWSFLPGPDVGDVNSAPSDGRAELRFTYQLEYVDANISTCATIMTLLSGSGGPLGVSYGSLQLMQITGVNNPHYCRVDLFLFVPCETNSTCPRIEKGSSAVDGYSGRVQRDASPCDENWDPSYFSPPSSMSTSAWPPSAPTKRTLLPDPPPPPPILSLLPVEWATFVRGIVMFLPVLLLLFTPIGMVLFRHSRMGGGGVASRDADTGGPHLSSDTSYACSVVLNRG
jgi:hypothetical protein